MWQNPVTLKDQIADIEDDALNFFFELKKNQPKDEQDEHRHVQGYN